MLAVVGDRLAAEEQLMLDELVHLLIGVVGTFLMVGMISGWITRVGIIVTGAIAGVLIILAFVLEQRLRDQLQAADNCSCISCMGDEA